MFKGACRLDDPAHRTIIFSQSFLVKNFRDNGRREATLGNHVAFELLEKVVFGKNKEVRPTGLEPVTPRSEVWCSIQLSYGRVVNPRRDYPERCSCVNSASCDTQLALGEKRFRRERVS